MIHFQGFSSGTVIASISPYIPVTAIFCSVIIVSCTGFVFNAVKLGIILTYHIAIFVHSTQVGLARRRSDATLALVEPWQLLFPA